MLPLFDLSRMGKSVARFKNSPDMTQAYIDETAGKISDVWQGRAALFDAMRWDANSTLRSGEHVLTYLHRRLIRQGVHATPVLGYDRWESPEYRDAIAAMELPEDPSVCLRLESEAISDSAEPELLQERVLQMLEDMQLQPDGCQVLIDFEDVTALSLEQLIDRGHRVMEALADLGFKRFATAGCSMPSSIELAVSRHNTTGRVIRKEWTLWRALRGAYPQYDWLFGDYGVRGPKSADDIIAPDMNGKIRYTTTDAHFIARGHSMRVGNKGEQMNDLAEMVVNSPHYMGPDFSWGDAQILECSRGEFRGTAWQWIAFDTSHHVAWAVQEVEEFVRQTARAR
jgi:hypothetical protein